MSGVESYSHGSKRGKKRAGFNFWDGFKRSVLPFNNDRNNSRVHAHHQSEDMDRSHTQSIGGSRHRRKSHGHGHQWETASRASSAKDHVVRGGGSARGENFGTGKDPNAPRNKLEVRTVEKRSVDDVTAVSFQVDAGIGFPINSTAVRITACLMDSKGSVVPGTLSYEFGDFLANCRTPSFNFLCKWTGRQLRSSHTIVCRIDTIESPYLRPKFLGYTALRLCVFDSVTKINMVNAGYFQLPLFHGELPNSAKHQGGGASSRSSTGGSADDQRQDFKFRERVVERLPHLYGSCLRVSINETGNMNQMDEIERTKAKLIEMIDSQDAQRSNRLSVDTAVVRQLAQYHLSEHSPEGYSGGNRAAENELAVENEQRLLGVVSLSSAKSPLKGRLGAGRKQDSFGYDDLPSQSVALSLLRSFSLGFRAAEGMNLFEGHQELRDILRASEQRLTNFHLIAGMMAARSAKSNFDSDGSSSRGGVEVIEVGPKKGLIKSSLAPGTSSPMLSPHAHAAHLASISSASGDHASSSSAASAAPSVNGVGVGASASAETSACVSSAVSAAPCGAHSTTEMGLMSVNTEHLLDDGALPHSRTRSSDVGECNTHRSGQLGVDAGIDLATDHATSSMMSSVAQEGEPQQRRPTSNEAEKELRFEEPFHSARLSRSLKSARNAAISMKDPFFSSSGTLKVTTAERDRLLSILREMVETIFDTLGARYVTPLPHPSSSSHSFSFDASSSFGGAIVTSPSKLSERPLWMLSSTLPSVLKTIRSISSRHINSQQPSFVSLSSDTDPHQRIFDEKESKAQFRNVWSTNAMTEVDLKKDGIDLRYLLPFSDAFGASVALEMLSNMPDRGLKRLIKAAKTSTTVRAIKNGLSKAWDGKINCYKTAFRYLPGQRVLSAANMHSSSDIETFHPDSLEHFDEDEENNNNNSPAQWVVDDASVDPDLNSVETSPRFCDDYSLTANLKLNPTACLLVAVNAVDVLTSSSSQKASLFNTTQLKYSRSAAGRSGRDSRRNSHQSQAGAGGGGGSDLISLPGAYLFNAPGHGNRPISAYGMDSSERSSSFRSAISQEDKRDKLAGLVGIYVGYGDPKSTWWGLLPLAKVQEVVLPPATSSSDHALHSHSVLSPSLHAGSTLQQPQSLASIDMSGGSAYARRPLPEPDTLGAADRADRVETAIGREKGSEESDRRRRHNSGESAAVAGSSLHRVESVSLDLQQSPLVPLDRAPSKDCSSSVGASRKSPKGPSSPSKISKLKYQIGGATIVEESGGFVHLNNATTTSASGAAASAATEDPSVSSTVGSTSPSRITADKAFLGGKLPPIFGSSLSSALIASPVAAVSGIDGLKTSIRCSMASPDGRGFGSTELGSGKDDFSIDKVKEEKGRGGRQGGLDAGLVEDNALLVQLLDARDTEDADVSALKSSKSLSSEPGVTAPISPLHHPFKPITTTTTSAASASASANAGRKVTINADRSAGSKKDVSSDDTKIAPSPNRVLRAKLSEAKESEVFVNVGIHQVPLFEGLPPEEMIQSADPMAWVIEKLKDQRRTGEGFEKKRHGVLSSVDAAVDWTLCNLLGASSSKKSGTGVDIDEREAFLDESYAVRVGNHRWNLDLPEEDEQVEMDTEGLTKEEELGEETCFAGAGSSSKRGSKVNSGKHGCGGKVNSRPASLRRSQLRRMSSERSVATKARNSFASMKSVLQNRKRKKRTPPLFLTPVGSCAIVRVTDARLCELQDVKLKKCSSPAAEVVDTAVYNNSSSREERVLVVPADERINEGDNMVSDMSREREKGTDASARSSTAVAADPSFEHDHINDAFNRGKEGSKEDFHGFNPTKVGKTAASSAGMQTGSQTQRASIPPPPPPLPELSDDLLNKGTLFRILRAASVQYAPSPNQILSAATAAGIGRKGTKNTNTGADLGDMQRSMTSSKLLKRKPNPENMHFSDASGSTFFVKKRRFRRLGRMFIYRPQHARGSIRQQAVSPVAAAPSTSTSAAKIGGTAGEVSMGVGLERGGRNDAVSNHSAAVGSTSATAASDSPHRQGALGSRPAVVKRVRRWGSGWGSGWGLRWGWGFSAQISQRAIRAAIPPTIDPETLVREINQKFCLAITDAAE